MATETRKHKVNLVGRVSHWSNGSDPTEWGWVIDRTNYQAYDILHKWNTWEDVPLKADIVAFMRECLGEGPYEPSLGFEIEQWLPKDL